MELVVEFIFSFFRKTPIIVQYGGEDGSLKI